MSSILASEDHPLGSEPAGDENAAINNSEEAFVDMNEQRIRVVYLETRDSHRLLILVYS